MAEQVQTPRIPLSGDSMAAKLAAFSTPVDRCDGGPGMGGNTFDQRTLPDLPASTSPELATLVARYTDGFTGPCEDGAEPGEWHAAARAILGFVPRGRSDLGVKLLIGMHYADPEIMNGKLATGVPTHRDDRLAAAIIFDCLERLLGLPRSADAA